ncbi:MAG: ACT domain-containing protein, partial [Anaerolineae bacterium]|nr:ACT domain-containing protein [Anaerolineae bacterium]
VPADKWEFFHQRLPEHTVMDNTYRLLTFDLPLESDLIGFMALVSKILAGAGVSILPIAAYHRDHVLVTETQFQTAWDALQAAQKQA